MQYTVALDPKLGLSADEFVEAWNNSEQAAVGPAVVDETPHTSFLPFEVTMVLIGAAASVPATVIANFVTDYVRRKFIDRDQPKVTVTTISTPDGQPVLVVRKEVM